jgi:hypothetical protein
MIWQVLFRRSMQPVSRVSAAFAAKLRRFIKHQGERLRERSPVDSSRGRSTTGYSPRKEKAAASMRTDCPLVNSNMHESIT